MYRISKRQLKYVVVWLMSCSLLLISVNASCSISKCKNCKSGDDLNCQTCDPGYYEISGWCCPSSIPKCKGCSDGTTCNQGCEAGYTNVGGSCPSCLDYLSNCAECSSNTTCTKCVDKKYALNSNTTECLPCSSFLTNCVECDSTSVCTKCINDTLTTSPTTFDCQPCNNFIQFCSRCTSSTQCIVCTTSPNIALANNICPYCITIMPHCLNCSSFQTCTLCQKFYTVGLYPGENCVQCADKMFGCVICQSPWNCTTCSIGNAVLFGCSLIPGCLQVMQRMPSPSQCVKCDEFQFYPHPANGTCDCLRGHLAGVFCTQISGCTNLIRNYSGDFCVACNSVQHFIVSNSICICKSGYYQKGENCYEICGDGKLYDLACDDGNVINGDGCSSNCTIQQGFSCKGGGSNHTSKCILRIPLNLKLVCISKVSDHYFNN